MHVELFWSFRSSYSYLAMPALHRDIVEKNQQALSAAGHWGVPTFVFEGEPFFGEDRIDTLRWRLDKRAVQRKS